MKVSPRKSVSFSQLCFTLCALLFAGCQNESHQVSSGQEAVDAMERTIARSSELPSKILKAEFVEYKDGDGRLGPADYSFYARLKVAPNDMSKWTEGLSGPLNSTDYYSEPLDKMVWWIQEPAFKELKLYQTKKYFSRANGWMALDESNGYIYVYTFTM